MDFKIGGPSGPKATERKKATSSASSVGGASFASLLEAAGETEAPSESGAAFATAAYTPLPEDPSANRPRNSKEQAKGLLDTLQQLAEDAFAGQPTAALGQLQRYLASGAVDKASLSPPQRQVLDEVETRAAVEAEKLSLK